MSKETWDQWDRQDLQEDPEVQGDRASPDLKVHTHTHVHTYTHTHPPTHIDTYTPLHTKHTPTHLDTLNDRAMQLHRTCVTFVTSSSSSSS